MLTPFTVNYHWAMDAEALPHIRDMYDGRSTQALTFVDPAASTNLTIFMTPEQRNTLENVLRAQREGMAEAKADAETQLRERAELADILRKANATE